MAQRIWQNSYAEGVPFEIDEGGYPSVAALVDDAASQFSDLVAYNSFGAELTFNDVERLSRHVAAYLQNVLGLEKGGRVAMMAPNTMVFAVGMYGVIRAGGVQVNVNPMYSPRELQHQLNDADTDTIIVFSGSTSTLAEVIDNTPIKNVIVFGLDDLVGKGLPTPPVDGRLAETIDFMDVLEQGEKLSFEAPQLNREDLLFLQYTGGTTGLSKGAMLTHGNLLANIKQFEAFSPGVIEEGKEVVLTAIPMYHIYALMVNTLTFFKLGGTNYLVTDPRNMESFVQTWAVAKPSVFTGVNTLYNGLLHTPGFKDLDFSNLKLASGGGAPIQQAVSQAWNELTGQHIKEGYGLSETSPVLTVNQLSDAEYRVGIGVPVPSTDISLRDEDGNEVPQGEPGELCARGPQVMKGYWRQPEATADVTTEDGYFKTGDIAVMEPDGYFRIVDRKKDMILVSGFNVFPNEVEEEAAGIPGILESACVGVPDESSGEAVRLFAVKSDPAVTEDDVRTYLRERLAAYKVPKKVVFMDELPKSTVGKILRRELKT
jgi:long-chain acyl-CoA synthetase